MKKTALLLIILCFATEIFAQITPTKTLKFAERDSSLYLDYYETNAKNPYTVIFVFGGGFITGTRNNTYYLPYYEELVKNGYNVVAIDYRLGLKGAKNLGATNYKPLQNAISMAAEDLLTATKFIIDNPKEFKIDNQKIICAGSSAGAITVLQADYELCNRSKIGVILPDDFHYAGIISFAGAIFSTHGNIKYKNQPAPTFFLHGTSDRLVTYKQIKIANIGFIGSSKIAPRFKKHDYPYYFLKYEGLGHEVAGRMLPNINETFWFIDNYIKENKKIQREDIISDPTIKREAFGSSKPSDLYN